jgi:hypothetical protein
MTNRERDEQETLNMAQVLGWIEHLTVHQDILIDLDLICYLNSVDAAKHRCSLLGRSGSVRGRLAAT